MWCQVITPNLNVPAVIGMCLAYVQNAFGLGWTGSYALDGWNRNKANHQDWNIPAGVYVPIWFTGYWNGFNYGHVVIYKDGICYSSPYTNKNTHDQLGNVATVERIYGMKYLGWSEDMNGQRVIEFKEDNMPKIQNTPNWKARFWKIHHMFIPWDMSDEVFGSIVGQEAWTVVENWNDHPGVEDQLKNIAIGKLARQDNWEDQIHRLVAQVNELSKRPTQEQLDALTKQAADLQASAKAASDAAATAKADAQTKADELAKNEASQAEAKKTADNFLTALINSIFNKFK